MDQDHLACKIKLSRRPACGQTRLYQDHLAREGK
jgi:hypothetical protein